MPKPTVKKFVRSPLLVRRSCVVAGTKGEEQQATARLLISMLRHGFFHHYHVVRSLARQFVVLRLSNRNVRSI
jgi:hypothetical protein